MLYLIDKPIGISSFDVIRALRKRTGIKKMGHAGTLDPLATGMILIATGEATKLIPYLEWGDKTYDFCVDISGSSPSLDAGTPIIWHSWDPDIYIDPTTLRNRLLEQTSQIPPTYSALHIDGQRAYTLARQGTLFEIPARSITVSDVLVTSIKLPKISLQMRISSGGYIRSFAPLIANWYNLPWGYIASLRRTAIHFPYGDTLDVSHAQTLEDFDPSKFLPPTLLFRDFFHTSTSDPLIESAIIHGKSLPRDLFWCRSEPYIFMRLSDGSHSLLKQTDEWIRVEKNRVFFSSH